MKKFIKKLLALVSGAALAIGVGASGSAISATANDNTIKAAVGDTVATWNSSTYSSGYGHKTVDIGGISWVMTLGQKDYFGSNSAANHNLGKMPGNDLNAALAVDPTWDVNKTGMYGIIPQSPLANVGKITWTYTGASGNSAGAQVYVAHSTGLDSVYSLAELTAGTQGQTCAANATITFEFPTVESAYFAVLFVTSSTARFTSPTLTFFEGATGSVVVPEIPERDPDSVVVAVDSRHKVAYNVGETFNIDDLKLTATWNEEEDFVVNFAHDGENVMFMVHESSDVEDGYEFNVADATTGSFTIVVEYLLDDPNISTGTISYSISVTRELVYTEVLNSVFDKGNTMPIDTISQTGSWTSSGTAAYFTNALRVEEVDDSVKFAPISGLTAAPASATIRARVAGVTNHASNKTTLKVIGLDASGNAITGIESDPFTFHSQAGLSWASIPAAATDNEVRVDLPISSATKVEGIRVVVTGDGGSGSVLYRVILEMAAGFDVPGEITLDTSTVQKDFMVGDVFNSDNLEVTLHYSSGEPSVKLEDGYTISSPDMSTPGTKKVVVTHTESGLTAEYNITVKAAKVVASLEITQVPDSLELLHGAPLDISGLQGTVTYNEDYGTKSINSSTAGISLKIDDVVVTTATKVGREVEVTVVYEDEFGSASDTYTIEVRPEKVLTHLSVTGGTKAFTTGDAFALGDLKVFKVFNDNEWSDYYPTEEITSGYETDPAIGATLEEGIRQIVTVSLTENPDIKTTYSISVTTPPKTIESITIETEPKTEYIYRDEFSVAGLKVELDHNYTYENEIVAYEENSTAFSFKLDGTAIAVGDVIMLDVEDTYTVEVNYWGHKAEYEIELSAPEKIITGIALHEDSAHKVAYYTGNEFSLDGLKLDISHSHPFHANEAIVHDETTAVEFSATIDGDPISHGDVLETAGEFEIEIAYKGSTVEYAITVEEFSPYLEIDETGGTINKTVLFGAEWSAQSVLDQLAGKLNMVNNIEGNDVTAIDMTDVTIIADWAEINSVLGEHTIIVRYTEPSSPNPGIKLAPGDTTDIEIVLVTTLVGANPEDSTAAEAANAWAALFNAEMAKDGVQDWDDVTGEVAIDASVWSALGAEYAALSGDAKDLFKADTDAEITAARALYACVMAAADELTGFLVDSEGNPIEVVADIPGNNMNGVIDTTNVLVIAIITIALISCALVLVLALRRKKEIK